MAEGIANTEPATPQDLAPRPAARFRTALRTLQTVAGLLVDCQLSTIHRHGPIHSFVATGTTVARLGTECLFGPQLAAAAENNELAAGGWLQRRTQPRQPPEADPQ